jgi:hypothetical protein
MTPSKLFSRLPNIDLRLYTRTRFTSAVISVRCGVVLSFAYNATGTRWVAHIHAKKSAEPNYLAMVEFGEAEEWTKEPYVSLLKQTNNSSVRLCSSSSSFHQCPLSYFVCQLPSPFFPMHRLNMPITLQTKVLFTCCRRPFHRRVVQRPSRLVCPPS